MDLEKGREIFFKYNGSRFYIDRECPNEYKKCGIPLEIEKQWLEEIKHDLLVKVKELKGAYRMQAINDYIQISDFASSICLLSEILLESGVDTFSSIILLETLKQYLRRNISDNLKRDIEKTIIDSKKKLLEKEISVDDSYKNLNYMIDYDFSKDSIMNRINKL